MNPPLSLRRTTLIAVAAVALSLLLFAPRLWLMREYVPGSFQWSRAHSFLQQCENPFRRDVEPAMLWRTLPPLVCHTLGLRGWGALALPWAGVLAATSFVALVLRRRTSDWRSVAGATLLFTTTSAIIVPTNWLGLNDAWVWLGLLAVAFANSRAAIVAACLLCPWIDERFVIGFPLAWFVRVADRRDTAWTAMAWKWALLAPYLLIRLYLTRLHPELGTTGRSFVTEQFRALTVLIPLVPLGWWFGLRIAWAAIAFAIVNQPKAPTRYLLAAGVLGTGAVSVALASDLSRSIAILFPVALLGCIQLLKRLPEAAPRILLAAGVLNLVIPTAHLTYNKVDPINMLPVELYRYFR